MKNINLNLARGDDQTVGISLKNPNGSYYNLSGSSILFNIMQGSYTSPIIFTKITTGHYGAATGASYIGLSSAETSSFGITPYFYDIKLQDIDGKLTTLSFGNINFYPR